MPEYGFNDVLVKKVSDPDAAGGFVYAPETAEFDATTTRTGDTVITDLENWTGTSWAASDRVTPTADGLVSFRIPDEVWTGSIWLRNRANPNADPIHILPTDLAERLNAVYTKAQVDAMFEALPEAGGGAITVGDVGGLVDELDERLRSTDAVIYDNAARATVTGDPLRRVRWYSDTEPTIGGVYARAGDYWNDRFEAVGNSWVPLEGAVTKVDRVWQNTDGTWPPAPPGVPFITWVYRVANSAPPTVGARPNYVEGQDILIAADTGQLPDGPSTEPPPPEPEPGITAPGAVATMAALAGDGTIRTEWTEPLNDGGSPITGYDVSRNNPDWVTNPPDPATARDRTLTGFINGTAYQVGVRARNAVGPGPWTYRAATPVGPVVVDEPGGTSGTEAMVFPKHPVAIYWKVYNDSTWPRLSTFPANANVLNLAFATGSPLTLVGYGSEGSAANFRTAINALRARGVRVELSLGGAHNYVDVRQRAAIVQAVMNIHNNVCPLDGIDWDLEGTAPINPGNNDGADVVAIATELRNQRGVNFAQTMAPNGTTVQQYYPVGRALQRAGLLSGFGQQFYDTIVSESAMLQRINEAVNTWSIPASKYIVGTMMPPTSWLPPENYWTVDTTISRLNAAKRAHPTLAGAYLWFEKHHNYTDWGNRVGAQIKTWA